ncbi:acid stress-induced BolA-like protein IbaG/YrbA [Halospina denitrificans]|uniref:Acid stress-induced BolA-like protein IbaG/YrbA n=1 Tax=Halospina denitrificans TaxID=332522 RepID=A0A4R7JYG5_9GAMM|nr:BolA/IbaG family iron-sulfur metabolism protein [Halospina denitrificans]TDT43235.1 acid stress-induced BolA-like protein IbaG/YrbA [Halospina denitrificans]
MQAEDVRERLASALPDCQIEVQNDGNKFLVIAIGERFNDLSRVRRQQLIYAELNDLLAEGTIHALTIRAMTPEEWQARQQ